MRQIRPTIILVLLAALIFPASLITASASLYTLTVLSNNPVAYWRLDETGGNLAYDSVGGHNGTNMGGVTFSVPGVISNDPDTCYGFDGASGKIDVPFYPELNSKSFTVEFWARCTGGAGTYRSPLTSRTGSAPLKGFIFAATVSTWQFWIGGGGSAWEIIAGPSVVLGQWVHLVGTYDGTNQTFYVNGQKAGSAQVPYTPNPSTVLRIGAGASETTGVYWFPGNIDEVAVYNYALSAGQVMADYQVGTATLQFTSLMPRGASLVLAGLGGVSNGTYTLLTSTNLTLPLTNWTVATTNSFDANGHFNLTNPMNPAVRQQFYALWALSNGPASLGNAALWIPACGAWLGAEVTNDAVQAFSDHEAKIGRQLDVLRIYHTPSSWTKLTSEELNYINAGRKLLLSVKPNSHWSNAVGVANGGSATVDSQMTSLAQSIAGVKPMKVMLIVWHEPENDVVGPGLPGNAGTTTEYVEMWHNVRSIFDTNGATNVIWCWDEEDYAPLRYLTPLLWPGNSYVDWVMWDVYQGSVSETFTNDLQIEYNWMTTNSTPTNNYLSKPWGVAEWGVGINSYFPTVAAQTNGINGFNDALNKNNQFPRIKLAAYYDDLASALLPGTVSSYSNFANSPYLKQQCSP